MNILAVGDVVGAPGCEFLQRHLPPLKRLHGVSLCIVNGENSAPANGITPDSARQIFDSGADIITTGNHVYRRSEVYPFLDEREDVARPINFRSGNPGRGIVYADMGRLKVAVINVMGINAMNVNGLTNPFDAVEDALELARDCRVVLVDFHAEATSEKRAMGFFLDGRVSAVFGTHTHVLTADEQVLPGGTGYITDIGMTGPKNTVLGVDASASLGWLRTGMPARFNVPDTACMLNACLFEVDERTGRTVGVERISLE